MSGDRFVVLGLAHVRSSWFVEVARWSTAGSVPVEFLKCITEEEVRARLASGRPFSALLIDGPLPATDRDLIDTAAARGCPVIVVDDDARDWAALGAAATLPTGFDRTQLIDTLEQRATVIHDATVISLDDAARPTTPGWRGSLVAVTGTGSTGASTLAMALAQGFGHDIRNGGLVLLADLALDADQALLHDAGDIVPGVQELVEAHRNARPSTQHIRSFTFDVPDRRYRLLLGLRRHHDWSSLRPRAFAAALDGLLRTYRSVVADIDSDVEGEDQCGSVDVEERNLMARTVATAADVVVVVGAPGLTGLSALVRTVHNLLELGVPATSVLVVVNRAPRQQRARAEITAAFADLLDHRTDEGTVVGPVYLSERRGLDELVRDGGRLPTAITTTLANATQAVLDRQTDESGERAPQPVVPGSLGRWSDQEAASR